MTIKTLLVAAALVVTPMVANAQCMWGDHGTQEAAISCAEGTSWDATSMSCVAVVSS